MQVISFGAFSRVVRAGDARRFEIDLKAEREKIIGDAVKEALTKPPSLRPYSTTKIRGKSCVSYQRYEDHLVIRSIASYLRRRLRVRSQDRNLAIEGLVQSLTEGGNFSVIRRDIADFYETIDARVLSDRLLTEPAATPRVSAFVRHFFEQHCGTGVGLPRGIGLSAILSELYMQDFDRRVRSVPGVYRYFRYADDIIVLSTGQPDSLAKVMADTLPQGMRFNPDKSETVELSTTDVGPKALEYLGYDFLVHPVATRQNVRRLEVAISERKIRRAKSRVVLSVKAFERDYDATLLLDRIAFLTSNYEVRRSGATAVAGATHVRSGIYYNYFHCGVYTITKEGLLDKRPPESRELKALDGFLRAAIRPLANKLDPSQYQRLRKFSFYQGFQKRMLMRIPPYRVGEVKMVWRNV